MKCFQSLVFLVLISLSANAQIRNGNFEKWDTFYFLNSPPFVNFKLVPQVWGSNNQPHPNLNPSISDLPASSSNESAIDEYSIKIASISCGIDACFSGYLYQDIPLVNLSELSFFGKCDSLSGVSGCFIDIFGFNESGDFDMIFQDSIKEETTEFVKYNINVDDFSSVAYDSIRLQFRAKGLAGFEDPAQYGHTIFLVDGVTSNYLSNSSDINNTLEIYPNPFRETVVVNATKSRIRHVEVLNLHGQSVKRETCDEYHFEINLKDQADGFYLARVEFENGTTKIKKLCKNGN